MAQSKPQSKRSAVSRRDAFRALAVASPIVAATPAIAQPADPELAAAEARLKGAVEALRAYPLPHEAEPAVIFKP